ncbi:MAG TPA: S-layer homology domain-containing protein, partial [Symbiobacteriaceae bacterium]|nr:S-layer homology domain-containing protein [Symbiobacteriaceae bacterium]
AAAPPEGDFAVPSGLDHVIVVVNWDAGDADFTLRTPSGKEITPADADVLYEKSADRREAFYLIMEPEAGNWHYSITGKGALSYSIQLLNVEAPPQLQMTAPATDAVSPGLVTVSWQATATEGSRLHLYYATAPDELGTRFAEDLDPAAGSYQWDTSALPSGTYYVYGQVESDASMPVKALAAGRITVVNKNAPAAPIGLKARAVNGNLELSWAYNLEDDLGGYRIYLVGTDQKVVLGRDTTYTWKGLTPDRTYTVALAAYDTDGLESPRSEPVSVYLPAANPPALSVTWPPAITNQESVTVRGQIGAGATGTLYLNGRAVAEGLSGSFERQVPLFREGANQLWLVAAAPSGDTAEQEHEIYYDSLRPQLTVEGVWSHLLVDSSTLAVRGTVEPGARLTLNGRPLQVSPDGHYATTLSLVKGENQMELVAMDAAGNENAFTGVIISTVDAASCGSLFPDVDAGHPACKAVEQLAALGVVKGYPDGTYQPDRGVTRAEFAKMLVVALGQAPQPGTALKFSDVAGHWAATGGFLQTAVDLQAIAGFPDGTFQPDQPVTRAQVAKIAAASAGLVPAGEAPFGDVPSGAWYDGWVAVAARNGLIGWAAEIPVWKEPDFLGDSPATRAEAAMVLANLLAAGQR